MEWQEESLFGKMLYMKFPREMADMSEEMCEKRFPYWSRPQFLKIDEKRDRVLSISLLDKGINDDDIISVVTAMMWNMDHIYPQCCLTGAKKIITGGLIIGWFSYRTDSVVNEGRFHTMFLFALESAAVLGSINSPIESRKETEKVFIGMMDSIRVEKGNKKKC